MDAEKTPETATGDEEGPNLPGDQPESPQTDSTSVKRDYLFFSRSDQAIVGSLCLILTLWVILHNLQLSRWGREEIRIRQQQPDLVAYRVDVNRANWLELSLLEGIGEVLGKRIVTYREQQGGFESIEQLIEVKGIGPKTYAKIEQQLYLTPWRAEEE